MFKLKDIKKDYIAGDTTVHALRGISLNFRESEFVAIIGHSGCGKTTILRMIAGFDAPDAVDPQLPRDPEEGPDYQGYPKPDEKN